MWLESPQRTASTGVRVALHICQAARPSPQVGVLGRNAVDDMRCRARCCRSGTVAHDEAKAGVDGVAMEEISVAVLPSTGFEIVA